MVNCQICKNGKYEKLVNCGHKVCYKCLCGHLTHFTSAMIPCPIANCPKFIDDYTVREFLSNDQLDYYEILCYAPNTIKCMIEECPFFIGFAQMLEGHFVCPICGQPNCVSCRRIHDVDYHCSTIVNYDHNAIENGARETLKEIKRLKFINLQKEYYLIPNPSSFICSVCTDFILPRKGVMLRNCLHCFCTDCLKGSMAVIDYISQMTCIDPECRILLDSTEILALRSEEKLIEKMISEASSRFFQCKKESCTGMWDATNTDGSYQCHVCHQNNCIACKDIHDGKSCAEFRRTKRYIQAQGGANILTNNLRVKCFICQHQLIQDGGCGAMHCDRCGNHTCIFTGKMVGKHDPQRCYCQGTMGCTKIEYFCECTSAKPCHKDCINGCIPD